MYLSVRGKKIKIEWRICTSISRELYAQVERYLFMIVLLLFIVVRYVW